MNTQGLNPVDTIADALTTIYALGDRDECGSKYPREVVHAIAEGQPFEQVGNFVGYRWPVGEDRWDDLDEGLDPLADELRAQYERLEAVRDDDPGLFFANVAEAIDFDGDGAALAYVSWYLEDKVDSKHFKDPKRVEARSSQIKEAAKLLGLQVGAVREAKILEDQGQRYQDLVDHGPTKAFTWVTEQRGPAGEARRREGDAQTEFQAYLDDVLGDDLSGPRLDHLMDLLDEVFRDGTAGAASKEFLDQLKVYEDGPPGWGWSEVTPRAPTPWGTDVATGRNAWEVLLEKYHDMLNYGLEAGAALRQEPPSALTYTLADQRGLPPTNWEEVWNGRDGELARQQVVATHGTSDQRVELADDNGLDPIVAATLATDPDVRVRRHLAGNYTTPYSEMVLLTQDDEAEVRLSVATNPYAGEVAIGQLTFDDDADIRRRAVMHPNCPQDRRADMAKDDDPHMRATIATIPGVREDILGQLGMDMDHHVRWAVAGNLGTPDQALRALSDEDDTIRMRLAGNRNCPDDVLVKIAADSGEAVAGLAAKALQVSYTPDEIQALVDDRKRTNHMADKLRQNPDLVWARANKTHAILIVDPVQQREQQRGMPGPGMSIG